MIHRDFLKTALLLICLAYPFAYGNAYATSTPDKDMKQYSQQLNGKQFAGMTTGPKLFKSTTHSPTRRRIGDHNYVPELAPKKRVENRFQRRNMVNLPFMRHKSKK